MKWWSWFECDVTIEIHECSGGTNYIMKMV